MSDTCTKKLKPKKTVSKRNGEEKSLVKESLNPKNSQVLKTENETLRKI